ncbi:MAG: hypothetical protein AAF968_08015 [Pseudomonadota bacterium]
MSSGGEPAGGGKEPGFFEKAFSKGGTALVQTAVVSLGVFIFSFGANWVTDGGLIRVLGGMSKAEVEARLAALEDLTKAQGETLSTHLDTPQRLEDIEGRVQPSRVHESLVGLLGTLSTATAEGDEIDPLERLALSEEIEQVSQFVNTAKQLCHKSEVFRFCLSEDRCQEGSAKILRHPTPILLRPSLSMTKGDWLVATAWQHETMDLVDANGNRVLGDEGELYIYTPNDADGIEVVHNVPDGAVAGYEDFRIEYIYYDGDNGYEAPCTAGEGG